MSFVSVCTCVALFWATFLPNVIAFHGTLNDLIKDFPDTLPAVVENAFASAIDTIARDLGVSANDLRNDPDLSRLCPDGWADLGDGSTCLAPLSHDGPCPKFVKFGHMDPRKKTDTAKMCETDFAATDVAPSDFGSTCPAGWLVDIDYSCVAPLSYPGPCVGRKKFRGYGAADKQRWGRACGVAWVREGKTEKPRTKPQNKACTQNLTHACPAGWRCANGLCHAPPSYQGTCLRAIKMTHFDARLKKAFSSACGAPWPCD